MWKNKELLKLDLTIILAVALILLLTYCSATMADPYVSVGLGVHDASIDAPEINLGSSLGIVEVGYQYKQWDFKFSHVSGIEDREAGYGFNALSINYRWWLR